jgi:hypothetical protein
MRVVQVSSMLKFRVLISILFSLRHAHAHPIDLEEYGHLVVYFSAVPAFYVSVFSHLPMHPAWGQSPSPRYRLLILQCHVELGHV